MHSVHSYIAYCVTRSTNTRAASHLVQPRVNAEWDISPSLADHGQDDGTHHLFRQNSHEQRGLMSHDALDGPSEEDELFARYTPGTDIDYIAFQLKVGVHTHLTCVGKQ